MKAILILVLWSVPFGMIAQQLPQFSNFNDLGQYFNPAYTYSQYNYAGVLAFRKQWTGIDGAPQTQLINFNKSIKNNFAAGINLMNEKIGAQKNLSISPSFAYKLKFNKKNSLVFGLNGTITSYEINYNNLRVIDPDDVAKAENIKNQVYNFGSGFKLNLDKSFVAFSVPLILNNKISNISTVNSTQSKHYFLFAGTTFHPNKKYEYKPLLLLKYAEDSPLSIDAKLELLYKKKLLLGVLYRYNNSFSLNIGLVANKQISIVYAYDYAFNQISPHVSGTHEISLKFNGKPRRPTKRDDLYKAKFD